MAERLVTQQDLEKFPQLISQGVSVNMVYDFDVLEATVILEAETEQEAVQVEQQVLAKSLPAKEPSEISTKKADVKEAAPKKAETKKERPKAQPPVKKAAKKK